MPVRSIVFDIIGRDSASPAFLSAARSAEIAASRTGRAIGRMEAGSRRMAAVGSKLTTHLSLPLLAIGYASVKAATTFEQSMTKIHTQAGGSAKDVQVLSKRVLDLAKYAEQGPNELADSLYHLKSVGMDNVSAMSALKQASDLASVGQANLEETTNAMAGAWRTGIKGASNMHETVSTLNAVIGAGNMRMGDLNEALSTGILPSAKTFGLTLKDVGAALALFTDEGVPANVAATRLRMTFSLLGAPSKAAEKQLKGIGLSGLTLAKDMRKPNGLIRAIGDLKRHLQDPKYHLSLVRQSQLLSRAFGGGRSSSAILGMINNFDVLRKKQAQVTHSMGRFDEAVKAQRKTAGARFALMVSSLQRAAIILGNELLPIVTKIVQKVGDVAEWFNHLSPFWQRFAKWAGIALIAIGPVMAITGRLFGLLLRIARVVLFGPRWLAGMRGAQRSATTTATAIETTGTAAETASTRANLAALKVEAAQLSQQAAAERSAAVMKVAESEKAQAAARSAAEIETALRGTDSMLAVQAREASAAARTFARAMQLEADSAVTAAATTTVASEQMTRSLGRAQLANARAARGTRMRGYMGAAGLGLALFGQQAADAIGGKKGTARGMASSGMRGASTGAMIGMIGGPEGMALGAALGGLVGLAMGSGDTAYEKRFNSVQAINATLAKLPKTTRAQLIKDPRFIKGSTTRLVAQNAGTPSRAGGGVYRATPSKGEIKYSENLIRAALANANADRLAAAAGKTWTAAIVATGSASQATARQIGEAALAHTDLAKAGNKVGLTQKDLTNAIMGSNAEYQRTIDYWKSMGKPTAAQLSGLAKLRHAYQGSGAAAIKTALAQGKTLRTMEKTGTFADLLRGKLVKLNRQHASGATVERGFRQALFHVTTAIEQNGATLDQNTHFGRENAKQLKRGASYALAHAQAVYQQTHSLRKARSALADDRKALEYSAVAAGLNKGQVDKLLTSLGLIAKAKPRTKVVVDTTTAKADTSDIQSKIDNLHGKTVLVHVVTQQDKANATNTSAYQSQVPDAYQKQSGTGKYKKAFGGWVFGRGTSTSDSINARLSNGEFVVRASRAQKYGALLEAINGGSVAKGNAFRDGGSVNTRRASHVVSGRVELDADSTGRLFMRFRDLVMDELDYQSQLGRMR